MEKDFRARIKDIVIDSYLAIKKELNPLNRSNVFEMFGYDFIIDEDFRIWLLEVNTNPYLGIPNKYMQEMLPKAINDILKICVDPVFPPKK